MIDQLIKDKENLQKQLTQTQGLLFKILGAIEYIDQKIKEDFEKNKPIPEVKED